MVRDLLAGVYAALRRRGVSSSRGIATSWPARLSMKSSSFLVDGLVRQRSAGTPGDRQTLAEAVLRKPLFQTDRVQVLLVGMPHLPDADAIEAAERIASERPSEDDDLGRVATSLPSGGSWLAALGDPQHLNSWGPVFRHGLTLTDVMRGSFGLWHKPNFARVEIRHSMRLGTPVPNSTWPR